MNCGCCGAVLWKVIGSLNTTYEAIGILELVEPSFKLLSHALNESLDPTIHLNPSADDQAIALQKAALKVLACTSSQIREYLMVDALLYASAFKLFAGSFSLSHW